MAKKQEESYIDPLAKYQTIKTLAKSCEDTAKNLFDEDFSCGYEIQITIKRLIILIDSYVSDVKTRIQRKNNPW